MSSECCSPKKGHMECPEAGVPGKKVGWETVSSLVRSAVFSILPAGGDYYFCDASACDVVYFDATGVLIRKSDLRIPVHQKDLGPDVPVCYCFGHTPGTIAEEIERTGHSTVLADITKKVKAGECFCETSNPQGTCCLGNVGRVVKSIVASQGGSKKEGSR